MTKRKGIFDVNVDVRKILEGSSTTSKEASTAIKRTKVLSGSISVSDALDVITRQKKVSRNRSRTSVTDVGVFLRIGIGYNFIS